MAPLRVQTVRSAEELPRYRDAWNALHERAPTGDLFNSFAWIQAWLAAFWRGRPLEFRLAWEGERLVAVVPLLPDPDGELACPGTLVTPVNLHTPRCDILMEAPAGRLWDAVLDDVRKDGLRGPVVLQRIPADSPAVSGLHALPEEAPWRAVAREEMHSPTVRLPGDWEVFLGGLARHTRSEIRRKRRGMERAGEVRLEIVSGNADVAALASTILGIERASWKESAGSSLTAEWAAWAFYRSLLDALAQEGTLRVYFLHLDGVPVAYLLCAARREMVYALKTSFRGDAAAHSPGSVLMGMALEECCARGEAMADLLGVTSRWKRELANGAREIRSVCVFDPRQARCAVCQVAEHRVKPFARERLPGLVALKNRLRGGGG